jgi:hypothetical protein
MVDARSVAFTGLRHAECLRLALVFVQSRHFRLCAKARSLAESLSTIAWRNPVAESPLVGGLNMAPWHSRAASKNASRSFSYSGHCTESTGFIGIRLRITRAHPKAGLRGGVFRLARPVHSLRLVARGWMRVAENHVDFGVAQQCAQNVPKAPQQSATVVHS